MPTQEARIAPRSTLANLLSSQRRSAVQSERYRVQLARPFAGSAQIENAAKRAAAQLFPQPTQRKTSTQGGNKIHQSAYNVSNQKPLSSSSSEPSRRVTFISHDDSIPRKTTMRDIAAVQNKMGYPTKMNAHSPNVSIIRTVDRAAQQMLATKKATSFRASTTIGSTQKPGCDSKDYSHEIKSKAVLAAVCDTNKDLAVCIESQVPQNEQSSNIVMDHPRDSMAKVQNVTLRRTVDDSQNISVSKDTRICMVPHERKVKSPELSLTSKIESVAEIPTKKAKKKKKCSPFRARVGCVVAIRFRKLTDGGNPNVVWFVQEGNSSKLCGTVKIDNTPIILNAAISDTAKGCTGAFAKQRSKRKPKYFEVWSAPIPGKDDGLSLLGSWIRCAIPQPNTEENRNAAKQSPLRVLEGNVISIRDNDSNESGIKVVMLVDRTDVESQSDLQLVADTLEDATPSSSEQKMREIEAKIRGKDKVAVEVTLASLFDQRRGSKLDPGVIKQWAVRKRVTAKPEGKLPTKNERQRKKSRGKSLFVGDSNDTPIQQKKNWKWIASHAPPCKQTRNGNCSGLESNTRESISQLIGEVVKIDISPSSECSSTIATVTIKRLWTPEQLDGGRLPHHEPLELFDCGSDSGNVMYFQAPIEDLIVIGTRITRLVDAWNRSLLDHTLDDDSGWKFTVTHSYQCGDNSFIPLCSGKAQQDSLKVCHFCHRLFHDSQLRKCQHHNNNTVGGPYWCARCLGLKGVSLSSVDETSWEGPCCSEKRDSSHCTSTIHNTRVDTKTQLSRNAAAPAFADLMTSMQSKPCVDFMLPKSVGRPSLRPSFSPIVGDKRSKPYGKETNDEEVKPGKIRGKHHKRALSDTMSKPTKKRKMTVAELTADETGEKLINAECSRAVAFDQLPKSCWGSSKSRHTSFLRDKHHPRTIRIGKIEEKTALSERAARASQRRMIKSLSALGDASKSVDRLAGRDREHLLRFDKSKIHGWGVYAEEQINSGDLIIEYRGEIIGNAVADKREKEYEKAKLDDYMFRIDAHTVCDATLLGNVARYINASCSPNCYTQIITAGESKRIVIYAKKDIQRGEELCYDYKFSLEYDPAKRILCHCGSADCRGFMNWVSSTEFSSNICCPRTEPDPLLFHPE